MLYSVLLVFILFSLLTFGAVLPWSSFLLALLMMMTGAVCLTYYALRKHSWTISQLIACAGLILIPGLLNARLAVGFCAGIVAWMAARQSGNTLRFLKVLMLFGVLEALLGLTQHFISPGWIFGYINSAYRVSGTLINHNHFAGLLEMFIPIAFGLAYAAFMRYGEIARAYIYLLAAAFMGLALLLSVSRMGILSFLCTVGFLGIILYVRNSQRRMALAFTLTVAGLVVAGALWVGIDGIIQRYSLLLGQDALLREGRVVVFRDTIKLITAHPGGTGVGSFVDRFREYQTFRPDLLFDHAHNDYFETAAEWGMPAAMAFWTFVVFALVRAVRLFASSYSSSRNRGMLLACMGAVFSILIHSFADFNLEIPSNAMLFFSLLAIPLAMPMYEPEVKRSPLHVLKAAESK